MMNSSKMLVASGAAILLVASLALCAQAGGYAPCRDCQPEQQQHRQRPADYAALQQQPPRYGANNQHGPYHSYAVRPAIYGGPRLYTYRGYARQPAPIQVHMKAAAFARPKSSGYYGGVPAPMAAPLVLAIEGALSHVCPSSSSSSSSSGGYGCGAQTAAPAAVGHSYGLRPVKAVILAPVVAAPMVARAPIATRPYGGSMHVNKRRPSYQPQQQQHHRQRRPQPAAAAINYHKQPQRYRNHAALASQLLYSPASRPASYGSGHYYQALETLKARSRQQYRNKAAAPARAAKGGSKARAPATGGY